MLVVIPSKRQKVFCLIALLFSPFGGARGQDLSAAEWAADLRVFATELQVRHANPFHTVSREKFLQEVERVERLLPSLPNRRRILEFARLGALVADGHTGVFLSSNTLFATGPRSLRRLPVEFWSAGDTVFIIAADRSRQWLNGSVVTRAGSSPTAIVMDSLRALVSADNSFGVERNALMYLAIPEVLYGLGVASTPDSVQLVVRDASGIERAVSLPAIDQRSSVNLPVSAQTPVAKLVFDRRGERYWARFVPEHNVVYAQVNTWDIGAGEPERAFARFADSLEALARAGKNRRVIVDLRWNSGGRIQTARHLLTALLRVRHLAQDGRLFAIVGRKTFSASVLFVNDMERYTDVIIVGEPTAGRVNAYGDLKRFNLPHSKIEVRYSAVKMVRADPWDSRPAIFPDIKAVMTPGSYRAGEDPALQSIFGYRPRSPIAARLQREYAKGGVSGLLARYAALHRDSTAQYIFDEEQLDAVADSLIRQNRIADAVSVLERNVRDYPHVGWVWLNLAEGQRRAGNVRAARQHYERAFEIDKRLILARDRIREIDS